MKVVVTLDEEIRLDPDEALGEIELIGDHGGSIQRGNAWLDEWLAAVLEGLQGLASGSGEQRIEIMAETSPLVVRGLGRGARLTFRDDTITIDDLGQFEAEFKRAVRSVVERLSAHQGFSPDETWSRLVDFASS